MEVQRLRRMTTRNTTKIRTYSGVMLLPSFEDRFDYLKLSGGIGEQTFAGHRYLNQRFYQSEEWKRIRRDVIIRDDGCDLADPNRPIRGKILIHHIEPITIDDIRLRHSCVFDMENLICISFNTHNALHYGSKETLPKIYVERRPNDTCPWRWHYE